MRVAGTHRWSCFEGVGVGDVGRLAAATLAGFGVVLTGAFLQSSLVPDNCLTPSYERSALTVPSAQRLGSPSLDLDTELDDVVLGRLVAHTPFDESLAGSQINV